MDAIAGIARSYKGADPQRKGPSGASSSCASSIG